MSAAIEVRPALAAAIVNARAARERCACRPSVIAVVRCDICEGHLTRLAIAVLAACEPCRDELHAREVEQDRKLARAMFDAAHEDLALAADRVVNECSCTCPVCVDLASALGVLDARRLAVRGGK